MSSFGFGKPAEKREKTIDKAGLPRGPIVVDPASERDAVARGEQLGYVDRGQTDTQPSGAAGASVRLRLRLRPCISGLPRNWPSGSSGIPSSAATARCGIRSRISGSSWSRKRLPMRTDRRPDELALSRLFDLRCAMVLRVAWLLRRAEGLEVVERLFRLRGGVDDRARVAFKDP